MGRRGGHAVVLGASLAGLFTARALSEFFDSVTLVDRDVLPDGPVPRRGVPQSWQSHGLHARGREILEEFFPGLTDELVAHGASLGDVQGDVRWVNDGYRLRPARSGLLGIAFSRPLLEHLVRTRVGALPSVTFRSPVDVLDLVAAGDRVTGVRIRPRDSTGEGETLTADLVVDTTGRGSHTPVWLENLGFPQPEESTIDIGVGYTTWDFPREDGDLGGDIAAIITATVANPRFGAMLAAEGPRWQVTAGGTWVTPRTRRTSPRSGPSRPPCRRPTSATWSPSASRWAPAGCTGSRAAGAGTTSDCAGSRPASS